jgi:hypothetical protein
MGSRPQVNLQRLELTRAVHPVMMGVHQMVSFQDYLETCRFEDSPEADFVQMAQTDGRVAGAHTWEELRAYLEVERKPAADEIEAAQSVWQAFEQSQQR